MKRLTNRRQETNEQELEATCVPLWRDDRGASHATEMDETREKMIEGRHLDHHGRTGARQVMTPEGAERGARRLPEESRWSL